MERFSKLRIGTKLAIGFSSVIVLMVVIGVAGYISIQRIQLNLQRVFDKRVPNLSNLIATDQKLNELVAAERAMIFANAKSDIFRELLDEYEKSLKLSEYHWKNYSSKVDNPLEKSIIPEYEKIRKEWEEVSLKIVNGRKADTRSGRRPALDLSLGIAREKFKKMRELLRDLKQINLTDTKRANESASSTYKVPVYALITIIVISFIIGVFLSWAISRSISVPIDRISSELNIGADQLSNAASQLSSASQVLARGSCEQSESITQTTSAMENMAGRRTAS